MPGEPVNKDDTVRDFSTGLSRLFRAKYLLYCGIVRLV